MSEQRAPKGGEWGAVMDVLHALANMITVRSHYTDGHPAINQADDNAAAGFTRVLDFIPDLVVALVDGEFIVCERPLPDLKERLHSLAAAMSRHEIECMVFQRGVTRAECGVLGVALASPAEVKGRVREQTQGELMHILLRFVVRVGDSAAGSGDQNAYFVPSVSGALMGIARALATDSPIDKLGILAVANQIVLACMARTAMIQQRSWTRSMDDEATHAANVAAMTAALAIDAGYPQRVCIDITAAAIVHDVGHLFLPEEMRGVPEPLLDERSKAVFRNHTFAGAAMLLGAGCSPLWVAAAFEHHRGVDGGGYPALEKAAAPHELVRFVSLANYYDSKRTRLQGRADEPEEALRGAMALEERYFGLGTVRRFLKVFGVFPPGTTVELSSLEPAIVTRANPGDPWRPQVRILRGPNAGKHIELRDMHPAEVRHRFSIVRAISPPMLVLADAVIRAPIEVAPVVVQEVVFTERPAQAPDVAAKGAQDRARAQLGGMDAMLDALLTLPTEALVSAMPPAPSSFPRSAPMPAPAYQPPPQFSSRPPPPVARPAPVAPSMPPAQTVTRPPMPAPRSMPVPVPSSMPVPRSKPVPPLVMTRPPPVASRSPGPAPMPSARPAPVAMQSVIPAPLEPPRTSNDPQEVERALLQRLGSVTAVPVLIADVTKLNLDHRAAFVLRFLDGRSSIDDILDASGLPRVEALRILADLVARGVIGLR